MVVSGNGGGRLNFGNGHSEDAQDPLNKADGVGQRNQGYGAGVIGDVGLDVNMGGGQISGSNNQNMNPVHHHLNILLSMQEQ